MIIKEDIALDFKSFINRWDDNPMDFHMGNCVLYEMCKKYPDHDIKDIVVSKIWLIGRAYAVAIERRKPDHDNEKLDNDAFYYEKVAPAFMKRSKEIKQMLDELKQCDGDYTERKNAEKLLRVHKIIIEICEDITKMEKRSFASKYLHFHCPEIVLIYDSRAIAAVRKVVQRPDVPNDWKTNFDKEYADYFARVIEMTNEIKKGTGIIPTPRQIDSFLLNYVEKI